MYLPHVRGVFGAELGRPTSVDPVNSDPAHMVASFTGGNIGLFNMETQQLLLKMEASGPTGGGGGERGEEGGGP